MSIFENCSGSFRNTHRLRIMRQTSFMVAAITFAGVAACAQKGGGSPTAPTVVGRLSASAAPETITFIGPTSFCSSLNPATPIQFPPIKVTLQETGGKGITVSSWINKTLDAAGNVILTKDEAVILGPAFGSDGATVHIPASGSVTSASLSACAPQFSGGTLLLDFSGTDDNGSAVSSETVVHISHPT